MACTYIDPSNSDSDNVRFILQDTDCASDYVLDDAEIAFLLTTHGSVGLAAAYGARSISVFFAKQATKIVEAKITNEFLDRAKYYYGLYEELLEDGGPPPQVAAGGISQADMDILTDNTDSVRTPFDMDLMERSDYQDNQRDCDD